MATFVSSSRKMAWAAWFFSSIFYAYQYILRVMPNIMMVDIMEQFNIGAAGFGQFSGIYYLGYSLMHLPIGIMLDRFGPRRVMSVSILLTVVGLLPLLFAEHWAYPVLGRLLIGMGSSAAILSVFKIIRMSFSEKLFPRMLSFSVTIGLVGAIYGGGPVSYLRDTWGYFPVIEMLTVAGLVLAVVTYLVIPNSKSAPQGTVLSSVKEVFSNSRVLWTCFFAGLMVGPLEGFADVWGTAFLKQEYHIEGTLAASLPSLMYIGMCFGGPVLTFIGDKIGSYVGVIAAAGALMALSFIFLLTSNLSSTTISINFVLVGICSAYQILAIYKASTYVREEVSGLTTALANMIIMTFGYFFHSIMGGVVNAMGGVDVPQALAYGVAVIPIALCIGTAGFIVLLFYDDKMPAEQS